MTCIAARIALTRWFPYAAHHSRREYPSSCLLFPRPRDRPLGERPPQVGNHGLSLSKKTINLQRNTETDLELRTGGRIRLNLLTFPVFKPFGLNPWE